MSEALKALGQPGTFGWRGRELQVSPITLKIEGLFADGCRRRVEQGLRLGQANLGEATHGLAVRQHNDDLAACEYEWHGRLCTAALRTGGGLRELAYLCLNELQPFSRADMDALYRDQTMDADGLTDFNRLIALINDLKAPSPNG